MKRALLALSLMAVLAALLSPLASSHPDGLEKVAELKGFLHLGEGPALYKGSPMPDYSIPALGETGASTILAGLIGLALCAALGLVLSWKAKPGPGDKV